MIRKNLYKLISQTVLLFFLASSYLSASHIHLDNTCDDTDCDICIVVKNFQNISLDPQDHPSDDPVFEELYFNLLFDLQTIQTHKGYFSTAPPSAS